MKNTSRTRARVPSSFGLPLLLLLSPLGCGDKTTIVPEDQALASVQQFISRNLSALADSTVKLAAAAPVPDDDGWNAIDDAAAVDVMKAQWKRARNAYEQIEAAIAVLFPDLDYTTDQRYDAFLVDNGPDVNLFDDQNVTGIHAIERVLWAPAIPAPVLEFERAVPGYRAAAFPATETEADDFKSKLCARLVSDVRTMGQQFGPLALDATAAFRGVIDSMNEQREKATLAASGEEESRYAEFTLADMRANVAAARQTFTAFKPWLTSKNGQSLIDAIESGFARIEAAYGAVAGDGLPPVPVTWSSQNPSAADLQTPFGALWHVVSSEADASVTGSLVFNMNAAADLIGIPRVP